MENNIQLDTLIQELLGEERKISGFSLELITRNRTATEATVKTVYGMLRGYGLNQDKIAKAAYLLVAPPENIRDNYRRFMEKGTSHRRIVSQIHMLGRSEKNLDDKYSNFEKYDILPRNLKLQPQLLGLEKITLETRYKNLRRLGLSNGQILKYVSLLSLKPNTVNSNYQNCVGLLKNGFSGKAILLKQPQLLGIPYSTLSANVLFADINNITEYSTAFLGTSPQTKRRKVAYLLREVCDYRAKAEEARLDAIKMMYSFLKKSPRLLLYSINALNRELPKIQDRFHKHIIYSK